MTDENPPNKPENDGTDQAAAPADAPKSGPATGTTKEQSGSPTGGDTASSITDKLHKVVEYLGSRPPESWGFFLAGIVLGLLVG